MRLSSRLISTASVILVAGCSGKPAGAPEEIDDRAIEQPTHGSYVAAISSNDVDMLMSNLTDDIVYQGPGAPEVCWQDGGQGLGRGLFWLIPD